MTRLTFFILAVLGVCTAAHAGPDLTKAYILSVIKDAVPDVEECGRTGETVTTKFVINEDGAVKDAKAQGKHAHDAIGACVTKRVSQMRFGPNRQPLPVKFPFKLGKPAASESVQARADAKDAKDAKDARDVAADGKDGGKQLSKQQVVELLKVIQPDLAQCGVGVVKTKFTIQPSGVVRAIKIDGAHADDTVGHCVSGRLARVRFPAAQGSTPVSFPFRLE